MATQTEKRFIYETNQLPHSETNIDDCNEESTSDISSDNSNCSESGIDDEDNETDDDGNDDDDDETDDDVDDGHDDDNDNISYIKDGNDKEEIHYECTFHILRMLILMVTFQVK